ncbi:hypothetical protein EGW08_002220 [Elysia chlorotica]|uniref:SUEL-type lectin domain-containing protein n=1 Tax=Elysia chlorotica TaxID=188477 RepID=A0A433U889_ELYCH|nr:hypothetical protein EGW08_002220 [Elysia chlorotica]
MYVAKFLCALLSLVPVAIAHTTENIFSTLWQMPAFNCRDCLVFPVESDGGYKTDTVPCAANILSMQLLTEASGFGTCKSGISYGFFGAKAWTDRGCRGTFRICFVEGTVRQVSCASDRFRPRTCSIGSERCDRIESISVTQAVSDAPCINGFSYSIDRQGIHVSKGCRASFQVGCRECGVHSKQQKPHSTNIFHSIPFFNDPFIQ